MKKYSGKMRQRWNTPERWGKDEEILRKDEEILREDEEILREVWVAWHTIPRYLLEKTSDWTWRLYIYIYYIYIQRYIYVFCILTRRPKVTVNTYAEYVTYLLTRKPKLIRCRDDGEMGVSRHQLDQIEGLLKHLEHHSTIVFGGV